LFFFCPDLIPRKNVGLPPPDSESIDEVRIEDIPTETVEEINEPIEPCGIPPPTISVSHVGQSLTDESFLSV
jgi:hypothetical protein